MQWTKGSIEHFLDIRDILRVRHDSDSLVILVSVVHSDNTFRRWERVEYGKFVHQYIVLQLQRPYFLDLHFLGTVHVI